MLPKLLCLLVLIGGYPFAFLLFAQPIQFQQLNVEDGLSHNHVTSIVRDERGFLWFGTPSGLNRYDGHEVKVFRHIPNHPYSLADSDILDLFIGPHNRLWVKTKQGMNIYDDRRELFTRNVDSVLLSMGLPVAEILAVRRTAEGKCWFLQGGGNVSSYDEKRDSVSFYPRLDPAAAVTDIALDPMEQAWAVDERGKVYQLDTAPYPGYQLQESDMDGHESADFQLFIDRKGHPWIHAASLSMGVFWWPQKEAPPRRLTTKTAGLPLSNPIIFGIAEDPDGNIWIATDHGGVNIIGPNRLEISYLLHDEYNDRSISQNSIMAIYCDPDGIMWAGTFKRGISYYHPSQVQFALFQRKRGTGDTGLPFDDINHFAEDSHGNIWIGTNGGGLIYFDRSANRFTQYRHDPQDPNSLGSDVIVELYNDDDDVLWIGTYYGGLNRFDGRHFVRYMHTPSDTTSIPDNSVWEIFEDSQGRFWVGTLKGGLAQFDRKTGRFKRPGPGERGFTQSAYISAIAEDHRGGLWFGTASGIEYLTPEGIMQQFTHHDDTPGSLSSDHVTEIIEDSNHRVWVATRNGLNLYDATTGKFRTFDAEDGLPDNNVLAIAEDREGTIWVSTTRGISAISEEAGNPVRWRFSNYDRRDGLQANAFNEDALIRIATGELLFGGPSGLNIINPPHIQPSPVMQTAPILTDFQLGNRSIEATHWRDRELVKLSHHQNTLAFVVSSLYFLNKDRAYFRYQLAGFDQEWSTLDRQTRKATFTNLDPGHYRFRVMVSEDGESWSAPYTLAAVTIMPPFWKTGWAYFLYFVFGLGTILLIRHIERTREKTRFALQRERQEARSKLEKVLKQQASLQEAYKKKLDVFPSDKPVVTADELFLSKALDTVEQHISDPTFSVESFAHAMHISRVSLYKRIATLTGRTPSEFIRDIRVRRGAQLLEQSGYTVAEVAYEVGFSNPKQFSKYFKLLYGVVPSSYRK